MFVLSLVAIVVQDVDAYLMRDAFGVLGISSLIVPSMVFVIAVLLLLYSRATKAKRWLN
jgi:hypothetical protein